MKEWNTGILEGWDSTDKKITESPNPRYSIIPNSNGLLLKYVNNLKECIQKFPGRTSGKHSMTPVISAAGHRNNPLTKIFGSYDVKQASGK
jgi:hypothetical protein